MPERLCHFSDVVPRRARGLRRLLGGRAVCGLCVALLLSAGACGSSRAPQRLLSGITQDAINQGLYKPADLFALGERVFDHAFSCAEGAGLRRNGACVFDRVRGPEAQTCLECHNSPVDDGGGTLATNVLRLFDPPSGRFVERNPPHLFGVGYVELLAAEMTQELQAQRAQALATAQQGGVAVQVTLHAKGLDFGPLQASPDGRSEYLGSAVHSDLVVRPFMAKGLDATLRSQNLGAVLGHLGIQPTELVGTDTDPDQDGVHNELTVGQVSALVGYQALLPLPSYIPQDGLADLGAQRFVDVGCADCHTPLLRLEEARYWLADPAQPSHGMLLDLPRDGQSPRGVRLGVPGPVLLPLFSDLRRHDLGPELADARDTPLARTPMDYLLPADSAVDPSLPVVPRALFVTPRLWGVGSTAPYLHDGRATDLWQAIAAHGGEAAAARDSFLRLAASEQQSIVSYLKSLQLQHGAGSLRSGGES